MTFSLCSIATVSTIRVRRLTHSTVCSICGHVQDFERELKEDRRRLEEMEAGGGEDAGSDDPTAVAGWQQVEVMETQPVELSEQDERNIMEDEPVMNAGRSLVASSLRHRCVTR